LNDRYVSRFNPAEISDVYPARPVPIVPGEKFLVVGTLSRSTRRSAIVGVEWFAGAGKLLAKEATLTVQYGFGARVTSSKSFTLRQSASAANSPLVARLWARECIARLLLTQCAFGRRFRTLDHLCQISASWACLPRRTRTAFSPLVRVRVRFNIRKRSIESKNLQVESTAS
jgi:hypothetical protein